MRIGLLQPGHLPEEMQAEMGDYPELYARLLEPEGLALDAYPVVDGVFPDSVHAAEGWLIGGSRHGAYEDLPWIRRLEGFVRDAYSAAVPMVGICFGHQIIAQALGGRVEKFAGGWGVGAHDYDWDGQRLVLNAWHQDQVTVVPAAARVAAASPFCKYAALVYPDRALTVQPHPEFDAVAIERLMSIRGPGMIPAERLDRARDTLDRATDAREMARRIAAFFREARARDRVA